MFCVAKASSDGSAGHHFIYLARPLRLAENASLYQRQLKPTIPTFSHPASKSIPLAAYLFGTNALAAGLVASGQHALIWIATSLHFETTARRPISRVEQGLLVQVRTAAWKNPEVTNPVVAATPPEFSAGELAKRMDQAELGN